MISKPLGNDIYLSFLVKVRGRQAIIDNARVEVLKNEKSITQMNAEIRRNRVSVVIPSAEIKSTGDYIALFDVFLEDMGKEQHDIPFMITESPLGKKRINVS